LVNTSKHKHTTDTNSSDTEMLQANRKLQNFYRILSKPCSLPAQINSSYADSMHSEDGQCQEIEIVHPVVVEQRTQTLVHS